MARVAVLICALCIGRDLKFSEVNDACVKSEFNLPVFEMNLYILIINENEKGDDETC